MSHNGYCKVSDCKAFYHGSTPYCEFHAYQLRANEAMESYFSSLKKKEKNMSSDYLERKERAGLGDMEETLGGVEEKLDGMIETLEEVLIKLHRIDKQNAEDKKDD